MTRSGRTLLCATLIMCVAALTHAFLSPKNENTNKNYNRNDNDDDSYEQRFDAEQRDVKPFRAGNEYTFTYDTQISTGMVPPDTSEDPGMPQQNAITRMQADAKMQFSSERHGSLQLQGIRFGQLNTKISEPSRVKPMQIFEPKQIPSDKQQKLQLPCQFIYVDGVFERIQFHPQDDTWSKNIKRGVLNMIQLNLKKNNAQGLRLPEELSNNASNEKQNDDDDWEREPEKAKAFNLPEVTIEGECQAMYTVQKIDQQRGEKEFSVTKSIDFKQCRKIADVAYGYQTQQIQPQCAQCQQQWYKQQQGGQRTAEDLEQKQQKPAGICAEECDPKEVKEQKLSRSTVQRCVLEGDRKQYGVRRCEMTSQYVYKNLNAEAGQYGSAMHAVAVSELVFRGVQPKQNTQRLPQQSSDNDETLLFSNQLDVDEKRFYMYGDDEYDRNTPFKDEKNKVPQAELVLQKLVQTASNKDEGIEIEAPIKLQRLVEILRMCSIEELKQIDRATTTDAHNNANEKKEMAAQFFTDALAIAGTRNTIALLVEKILAKEMSPSKAAQSLRSLQGLPAPSDAQVKLVQRLCHSDVCKSNEQLMQSCWLTFGSMINELCQHKTQRVEQQTIVGAQSGFSSGEVCSLEQKQKYRDELVQKFKNAQTMYEKVLALKVLGNAGLPQTVDDVKKIIRDESEPRVVRTVAIDSLRRLRVQMPTMIQGILMPVFIDTRESSELRMAACGQIMNTLPEAKVIDQIVYALSKERSKPVLAFCYNLMKSVANTKNPIHQSIVSKHIRNALKLLNVDDQTLKMAGGRAQIPIYSNEQKEGVFVNFYSAFSSPQSRLPTHLSVQMNSVLNNDFQTSDIAMGINQQNIDAWMEQLLDEFNGNNQQREQQYNAGGLKTRLQRQATEQGSSLRNIFTALNIKGRRQSSSKSADSAAYAYNRENEQPFAMCTLRIADVDQWIITINGGEIGGAAQQLMKTILNARQQKPLLAHILAVLAKNGNEYGHQHIRKTMSTNLNEKSACIPTSAGLLLKAQQTVLVIGGVEAQAQLNADSSSSSLKTQCQARIAVNVAHIQKLECQLPIFATGVQSIRSLEMNAPVDVEATISASHGLQARIKVPHAQRAVRVLGLHTLPTTYTCDFEQHKQNLCEPKMKAIHNDNIDEFQREINTVFGRAAGLPFHVKGHLHRPSRLTNYKQMAQMLMAAENQFHVEFRPNEKTPREISLRVQASHFEPIQSEAPQFKDFYQRMTFDYANSNENGLYEQDFENMDSHKERRQKLDNYLAGKYQSGQMYKHALKINAQCVGGQSNCEAQMEIRSACNANFKFCKMGLDATRTAFNEGNNKWALKAQAQILQPDTVSSIAQLSQLNERNTRFIAHAECEWGAQGNNNNKQHLNVHIQGERAMKKQWRQIELSESRRGANNEAAIKRRTMCLNKFDLEADFKLSPYMQNMFRRAFEALKSKHFFATQTVQLANNNANDNNAQLQRVRATLVINPITQRHCNVTVQTPTEAVRIESMELPVQTRLFPLIRSSVADTNTHSVQQAFRRWAVSGRAECTADGRRVDTFDDVEFAAPISSCYSVLAKDCSSNEQPQFVVMMKALGKNDRNNKNAKEAPKKIKVITPGQTVECEPKRSSEKSNNNKLLCKVNGRPVEKNADNNEQYDDDRQTIEFNDARQCDVTINVRGVAVRFNGKKTWIKIAREFKHEQCGLCGHYDDDADDEWRMSNNERTDNLEAYHRSYLLKRQSGDSDNDECTADAQQDFYGQRVFRSGKKIWESDSSSSSSSSESRSTESDENDNNNDDEWADEEDFNGQNEFDNRNWYGKMERSNRNSYKNGNNKYNKKNNGRKIFVAPIPLTTVIEPSNTKICFSMEPVKQCPPGTLDEAERKAWEFADGSDFGYESGAQNKKQQKAAGGNNNNKKTRKTVQFACLERAAPEARRLLREARLGEVLDMSGHRASLTESVPQSSGRCVRY